MIRAIVVRRIPAALAVAAVATAAGLASGPGAVPGDGWKAYRSHEDAGFDPERLRPILERLDGAGFSAVLVARGGAVAIARGSVDRRVDLHGLETVVLAALAGMRVSEGKLRLEDRLGALEVRDVDPGLTDLQRTATLADLLGRTSCIAHPAAGETVLDKMERGRHLGHAPGSHVWLQPWDLNVLVTLLERDAAQGLAKEVSERISRPLALEDFTVADVSTRYDLAASIHPALEVRGSARDLARIGLLFLRRGVWGPQRVLDESWIARATSPRTEETDGSARGLLFRIHRGKPLGDRGAYSLGTEGGQLLAVVPALDLVVVALGEPGGASRDELDALLADLARAVAGAPNEEADLAPLSYLSAPTAELRVAPEVLRSYEGVYERECSPVARVRYSQSGLEVYLGAGYVPMIPVSETAFRLESTGERVFFEPEAKPPAPRFVHRAFVERQGGCFQILERFDDAVRVLRVNTRFYAEDPEVWLQLAEALVLGHRADEALEAARKASELDPHNERASRMVRQLAGAAPVEDLDHGHRH